MGATWKLQVAKAQFSKVVDDALRPAPQYVTRRGEKAVVVLSTQAYEELTTNLPSFKEFLLSVPKLDEGFEIERPKDYPRKIELGLAEKVAYHYQTRY